MKRFAIAMLVLVTLLLAGCDDDGGSGQSYAAPQSYPSPVPYGEPEIVDEAQLIEDMCRQWPDTFEAVCNGEVTY